MKLSSEVLTYQNLINLNLFTDAAIQRMKDREFIEELLGYLKLGIKSKKAPVDQIYKSDIDQNDYEELKEEFYKVINIIHEFNEIKPLSETRYKQKNDFFTLFNFVHENKESDIELLKYQYKILLLLDGVDANGRQFIRPTNELCLPLREYANNCVSQSNSKDSRDKRLDFFNSVLKNTNVDDNQNLIDILNYLETVYGEIILLQSIEEFELIDISNLNVA